jgi:RNA polymerase sigma-70 factor, ECF subfamily
VVDDFERWYLTQHPRIVRAMTVVARDGDVAADVAAEAFSRAYQRWDRLAQATNPDGWVYRVAVNVLRRRLRRQTVESRLLRRTIPTRVELPPEVSPELWAAVAQLPTRQREAIALRYVADLSERQVAEAMGIALGSASACLAAARRRLAVRLQHHEEEPTWM